MLVNMVVCVYFLSKGGLFKTLLWICVFAVAFYLVATNVTYMGIDTMVESGSERAFAYFTDDGIDLGEGGSNRDVVYDTAIELITDSPMFGSGFYAQYDILMREIGQPYCHNIFLELILQGGIFYFIFGVVVLFYFFKAAYRLVKKGDEFIALIPLTTLPTVLLMFSGTYLYNPVFWFVVVFCLAKGRRIAKSATR